MTYSTNPMPTNADSDTRLIHLPGNTARVVFAIDRGDDGYQPLKSSDAMSAIACGLDDPRLVAFARGGHSGLFAGPYPTKPTAAQVDEWTEHANRLDGLATRIGSWQRHPASVAIDAWLEVVEGDTLGLLEVANG